MNHVRPLEEILTFAPFNYEYVVALPTENRDQIIDVLFRIHGKPTLTSNQSLLGTGCEDVRVYLDTVEVTPSILKVLRSLLDARDQVQLKAEYKTALDHWLHLEKKLGAAYPIQDFAGESARAQALVNTTPLSSLLTKLGDHAAGWSGQLHLFHYLYCQISIPPISLLEVIKEHVNSGGAVIDPENVNSMTFSCGPCRLYDANWSPTPLPVGTISASIEPVYHDPLEDEVEELKKTYAIIDEKLEKILVAIGSGPQGLRTSVNRLSTEVGHLKNATDRVSGEIANHELKIKSLAQSVADLQTAVTKL